MGDRERREERGFFTNGSVKGRDWLEEDYGEANHPWFYGQKCAYGDWRDKSTLRQQGSCPYSREKRKK